MGQRKVLVHIVTWNSEDTIARCIEHVAQQQGFTLGSDLFIHVTDNASTDSTAEVVRSVMMSRPDLDLSINKHNLGFCGAHNQGASRCIDRCYDAMLVLNPDVGLTPGCLAEMLFALKEGVGLVTPKLLRAGEDLKPLEPMMLDAAGMILTPTLRHFDRGSGEVDVGKYETREEVFGATGACVLISRECIADVSLPKEISDRAVWSIYPALQEESSARTKLFDEAFFAYREDADLSWRVGRRRWRCVYEPSAVAYHVRVVTPERRSQLSPTLNSYSVRNRFLLQLNNWDFSEGLLSLFLGVCMRNIVVILGVFARERSSLGALREAWVLAGRARAIYRATRKS
jgi:GT2 family glycosyltransferase